MAPFSPLLCPQISFVRAIFTLTLEHIWSGKQKRELTSRSCLGRESTSVAGCGRPVMGPPPLATVGPFFVQIVVGVGGLGRGQV